MLDQMDNLLLLQKKGERERERERAREREGGEG